jgi:exosome complex protein LRP1
MSYLPAELKENLKSLSLSLDLLSANLNPIFEFDSLNTLNSQLSTEDSLRLNTALAYTLHSLYYILLKTQGKDLSDHPLKQEIERIKEYVGKVQEALSDKKPSARIDMPVANKVINSHLEDRARQLKGSTPLPNAGHLTWKTQLDKILKN